MAHDANGHEALPGRAHYVPGRARITPMAGAALYRARKPPETSRHRCPWQPSPRRRGSSSASTPNLGSRRSDAAEPIVAERLLAGARDTGRYSIWIGYAGGIDDMHDGNVNDDRGQDVGNRVQRANNSCEPRPRGSRSTGRSNIDRPDALAVSATAHAIAAFTATAGRGIAGLVEAPGDRSVQPNTIRQRCHA
jgi:hypothetical protein